MSLPAPLTPADCDLRDFEFMPLDVVRLRDSDLAAVTDAEVFRSAVLAWCAAWHQVPAASLPDDDAAIARLIGMGRDVRGWKKLRAAGALRGFVLCSDGRLYHEVVSEKACKSWEAKNAQRNRTEKAREARLLHRQSQTKKTSVTDSVVIVTTGSKVSKGKVSEEDSSLRSESLAPKPKPIEIPEWIPPEPWAGFVEMRKRIKAPLTDRGILLIIADLRKLRHSDDIGAVLDQSTKRNWKGVFRVKHDDGDFHGSGSANANRPGASTAHQRHLEGLALLVDEADGKSESVSGPAQPALDLAAHG